MGRSDRSTPPLLSLAFPFTSLLAPGYHACNGRSPGALQPLGQQDGGPRIGGLRIHHLVWGILLLSLTGCAAIGFDRPAWRNRLAALYGVGAALTLDAFALWLNLEDVHWARQGRQSVAAGIVMGAVRVLTALGRPFWRESAARGGG